MITIAAGIIKSRSIRTFFKKPLPNRATLGGMTNQYYYYRVNEYVFHFRFS